MPQALRKMDCSFGFDQPDAPVVLRPLVAPHFGIAESLGRELERFGREFATVSLDLRGVDRLGEECAAVIVEAIAAAQRRGGRLVLLGLTDALRRELSADPEPPQRTVGTI
ncbi:STAS domain-containing protein [Conexibacter sp. CPCC 206217]|uniref:STAS domain-containing protein n=1 Tax=Conexibacter sp. CPCC 206217 TaxID=3064574 RepID=UPI00271EED34|nr:STAS domain-containing protein [Conexibacter sp. CPCC 206217]MDO8208846.1 STAS domain-containing protein [Conexibacter sp. CPCC 206217]